MRWLLDNGPIWRKRINFRHKVTPSGNPPVNPPVDPLAALYGTGVGQVPLHLIPENAVLDGSGNVTSVSNQGGAGSAFAVTANTTGITLSGARFNVPSANVHLLLPALINMVGSRLFMLVQPAAPVPTSGTTSFAGRAGSTGVDDNRNTLRYDWTNKRFQAQRYSWDGTSGSTNTTAISSNTEIILSNKESLIELEFSGEAFRSWIDGAFTGQAAFSQTSFSVDRFFSGQTSPFFTGLAGDILLFKTDGSSAMATHITTIRNMYVRKYGLILR